MTQYKNNVIQEGNILYYIFPIYLAEFFTYPNELEINNTNFINKIHLKSREDLYYSKYFFEISGNCKLYKVLYFQNNEILNYLSLYSSTIYNTVINVKCEEKKDLQNIEQRNKLFFRVDVKDYSDKKVDIELNIPI